MSTRQQQIAYSWSKHLSQLDKIQVQTDQQRWYVRHAGPFLAAMQPPRLVTCRRSMWISATSRSRCAKRGADLIDYSVVLQQFADGRAGARAELSVGRASLRSAWR
jgi:hypothetical protein